jgi:hypothetical protein
MLQIWEIGQTQHPLERALTLLAYALPEQSADALAKLSVGQRDSQLLTLRSHTFGPTMNGFAVCPQCGEQLEFALNVTDLYVGEPNELTTSGHEISVGDYRLQFRLPDSRDLAAAIAASASDLATARQILAQRCIQQVHHQDAPIAVAAIPPEVLTQLAQRMADCDPQAELWLDLTCPACQHGWQVLFDIVSFFWAELTAQAKRLLQEVHTLARSYGWREADILAMSAQRRQLYLDLVAP